MLTLGKTTLLKSEDWVVEGAVVQTTEKSFAKLVFLDKSQMNIGPNSEMKIVNFSGSEAGVIDLVKGSVRSMVTKDYLQMKDVNKSKLFIRTPNAVMGVRGTDFSITQAQSGIATVILFEGSVQFNKLDAKDISSPAQLENIVNQGVRVHPGEFTQVQPNATHPTLPARLNVQQLEKLEKNVEFNSHRAPSSTSQESSKNSSVIPEGLDSKAVSNAPANLKNEIGNFVTYTPPISTSSGNPDGFAKGDQVQPTAGSMIDPVSGVIIPPGPGSVLDANTGTYIATAESGTIAADGSLVPPKNVEITPTGQILVTITDKDGTVKVQEIEKPSPVKIESAVSLSQASQVSIVTPPVKNDILNANFTPSGLTDLSNNKLNQSGGVTNVNDAVQTVNSNALRTRTIYVNP